MDTSTAAGGMDTSLLISWVIWLYSGFFNIGALAGEVQNPARSYKIAIVVLVPATVLFALWPLAISVVRKQARGCVVDMGVWSMGVWWMGVRSMGCGQLG